MKNNVGNWDRALRALVGVGLLLASVLAPLPWPQWVRLAGLGGSGVYMLLSALAGTCLGYALLGKSTCPTRSQT